MTLDTKQPPLQSDQAASGEVAHRRLAEIGPDAYLDELIASASREQTEAHLLATDATVRLRSVEPHPFAHGYTAGEDCRHAGFTEEHFTTLPGMFEVPWTLGMDLLELTCRSDDHDYLLKGFPPVLDKYRENLVGLNPDRPTSLTARAFRRDPLLGIGMAWFEIGFRRRDRDAWVGAFATGYGLRDLIAATPDCTPGLTFGAALAATVRFWSFRLEPLGRQELLRRAAERDAERQASWSTVAPNVRKNGAWRGRAATKRQRHLIARIELALGRLGPIQPRRGEASDWIAQAGGNPRFANLEKEND